MIVFGKNVAERVIEYCSVKYGFDKEEAMKEMNIEYGKKEKKERSEKKEKNNIVLPFSGGKKEGCCGGLEKSHGLYTQCEKKVKDKKYCSKCEKTVEKYGTIEDRMKSDLMDYTDKEGNKVVAYKKIMKKLKLTEEVVREEAKKQGLTINEIHFEELNEGKRGRPKAEKEPKEKALKKGRPKKSKKVVDVEGETDDLFASLVASANESEDIPLENPHLEPNEEPNEVESESPPLEPNEEPKEVDKEALKQQKEAEKAQKEALKQQKEAEKAQKEAEKAQKEAEKAQKEAEKEALKQQKEALKQQKEAEKAQKEAEKEAKKAAKKDSDLAPPLPKVDKKTKKAAKTDSDLAPPLPKVDLAQPLPKVDLAPPFPKVDSAQPLPKVDLAPPLPKVEEEEPDVVKKIEFEGVKYLKSKKSGIIYNMDQDVVGKWCDATNKIIFEDPEDEESEDEYEDE